MNFLPASRGWFCLFGAGFACVVIGAMSLAMMAAADGHFVFPLDDPYIHLAVAEMILEGGYGINSEETSAPSSSILYPFLMAVALKLGLGGLAPLAVNIPAAAASAALISDQIWTRAVLSGPKIPPIAAYILSCLAILGLNIPALALTGMEHSLHVLASLLVVLGLLRLYEGKSSTAMLTIGVALAPLVRFEGFALSLATIATLMMFGYGRLALKQLGLVVLGLVTWLFWSYTMDLPILPSSVLTKSATSAAAHDGDWLSFASVVFQRIWAGLSHLKTGSMVLVPLIAGIFMVWHDRKLALVAIPTFLACLAHAIFGNVGHWNRYEIYAVVIAAAIVFYIFSVRMGAQLPRGRVKFLGAAMIVGTGFTIGFGDEFIRNPSASQNIYQQQFQMHRFATEYFPERVAVNDLGLVSFGNDAFILDLWGLGSERVRTMRSTSLLGLGPSDIDLLVSEKNVAYAMIYDAWFGDTIPANWCKGATIYTSKVTAGSDEVQFYLIDLSKTEGFNAAVSEFSPTMPEGTRIETTTC